MVLLAVEFEISLLLLLPFVIRVAPSPDLSRIHHLPR